MAWLPWETVEVFCAKWNRKHEVELTFETRYLGNHSSAWTKRHTSMCVFCGLVACICAVVTGKTTLNIRQQIVYTICSFIAEHYIPAL